MFWNQFRRCLDVRERFPSESVSCSGRKRHEGLSCCLSSADEAGMDLKYTSCAKVIKLDISAVVRKHCNSRALTKAVHSEDSSDYSFQSDGSCSFAVLLMKFCFTKASKRASGTVKNGLQFRFHYSFGKSCCLCQLYLCLVASVTTAAEA